ncbi:zinc-binding alcohol dehydrogenase family protein [Alkalihalophilus marmarensis]|uniref:zinc-binding alcohol dehydrogenase family protein n=1 Tax=Alkalihalophilus marmarensis TaxID=521377 RepID=UPI0020415A25|nr:zinc-binding alcohol dehydrogenase family protein [Alkalihalophilus marmarensis]MCM3489802.1 zinc-binding alcohol dehydrogenase family protein [Alkalihalophilus marmarensis]
MKVVNVEEAGSIAVIEKEVPEIKAANEVLMRVRMVGICGSDMHIYHGTNPLATYPRIIGHEVTGEVVKAGESVSRLKEGDKVVLEPIDTCGECYACRNGRANVCEKLEVYGVHRDGGMQEYMVVNEAHLHKVDASIPFEDSVLVEPFTIGAQANWRGNVQKGDTVLIQGAGPIGICCLKVAKLLGATCFITDLSEERLDFALKCGADKVIHAGKEDVVEAVMKATAGEGANVVIDAVCLPQTFELGIHAASIAGRVVVLGFDERPSMISQLPITKKELTIVGSRLQTNQFEKVIKWMEEKELNVDEMVTHTFSIDEIKEAMSFIENNPNEVRKAVISM